jgi:hypothetical protein
MTGKGHSTLVYDYWEIGMDGWMLLTSATLHVSRCFQRGVMQLMFAASEGAPSLSGPLRHAAQRVRNSAIGRQPPSCIRLREHALTTAPIHSSK